MAEYVVITLKQSEDEIDLITGSDARYELDTMETYATIAEANKNLKERNLEQSGAMLFSKSAILSMASHLISE